LKDESRRYVDEVCKAGSLIAKAFTERKRRKSEMLVEEIKDGGIKKVKGRESYKGMRESH
jgi:hypothetical protein